MKRLMFTLVILVICVSSFVGCASQSPSPAQAPTPTTAPKPAPPPSAAPAPITTPSVAPAPKPSASPVQTPSTSSPRYGGTLKWIITSGITIAASPADGATETRITRQVFETLLDTDDNERIKPWLAESWKIAPDGKSITLNLRKGVKFQDGTDFNAEAVKFNLELDKSKNIPAASGLVNVTSYDVLDEYSLRINLKQYDATLLLRLAQTPVGQMASPTALKKPASAEELTKLHMVGTGPFKFDSWQRDTFIKYTKWDGYWQKGRPFLDGIEIRQIADVTVGQMAFKAGEAQICANVDPGDAIRLMKEGYEFYIPKLHFFASLCPNAVSPGSPFSDIKVRQAVEYAIDRKQIADGIGMGYFEALTQYASKADPWYNPELQPRNYNPAKAKQLLAEAGYSKGFKTKITTDTRVRKDTLIAVQSNLKDIGIDAEIDMADVARAAQFPIKGWDGILMTGFPSSQSNFTSNVNRFFSQPYPNMLRPPGWQQKWDAITTQTDENIRLEQWKEIVKIMHDEAIVTPLISDSPLIPVNGAKDFIYHGHSTTGYWDPANTWLSK